MQAQVIVDLPVMKTDRPFTYAVPEDLQTMVAVGSRVHVPFGKGNRLLQGFVVGLSKEEEDTGLKSLVQVLDEKPVLTKEQLALADAMRHTVFSYKISLLKAMLPNLLNSRYDRLLTPLDESDADVQSLFAGQAQLLYSQLSLSQQNLALALVKKGLLAASYEAQDRKSVKKEKHYRVLTEALAGLAISSRAKKRQALKAYLEAQPEPGLFSDLVSRFSRPVVNFFVEEGVIEVTEVALNRSQGYFDQVAKSDFLPLNAEQEAASAAIMRQIGQEGPPFLLEGITGSGKTEVYLHIIREALEQGKTAIVLVPEISLTPQMTHRFISRFGEQVAIMHSGLSDGEKFDEWRKIKEGKAKVVVGARSAIFAPLENIGVIIIDEEHEASYKQESNPRYHARDVAVLRAKSHAAVLVLGSATPSIESRARAQKGVYQLLRLTQRANPKAKIPQVTVVDFRQQLGEEASGNFTPILLEKIKDRLAKKEQVVLMLNRRGYSSFMLCRDCGYVDECPNCDISLTLHMDTKSMNCHYCGYQKGIPQVCPHCQSRDIRYYGTGTQKAEKELLERLPEARVLRMDVDTTRRKGAHEKILTAFGQHEADILLGTQMIAKGLDFPDVTLVGVLNADTALNLPDFRSSERTFQLLTQVAGRAGRADKAGEVLIQTYNPGHYAIALAKEQDYEKFYQKEMAIRRQMAYPPYYYTVGISLSHADADFVVSKAYDVLTLLRRGLSDRVVILGPTPKPIARTHNLHHYQILIKYRFEDQLEATLNALLNWSQEDGQKGLRLAIDHEPQNFV
ncbi:primosomal protein N' [Streptococcus sp. DD12]|uniref:primosomal protein N' n=1 Tax=Streptococcus sp. DD12 TaxID=1777880 RepID=UPI00079C8102|nr:primosomal protein N' [Streptococcus sp. DD12]KXT75893.1 Helicase PriA [Streptococcus sp. DD12]